MAPFEPKTDSKEFELAIPEQDRQSGTVPAAIPADITIRLWRQDATGTASALTWSSESVLVYMIADLVAASYGRTAVEAPSVLTAHFDNANQALVAAKRIQLSILEFVGCRPGDFLGAAILIHPPISAGFSTGMAQGALRLAEPGQVVISETVSRGLRDLPGSEFRPVAALTTGGTEHSGLLELVWASAEQLAKLRESARARPTAVTASPAMGATMIVNAPLGAEGSDAGDKTGSAMPKPPADSIAHTREAAFQEGLAEFQERHSFITRSRVIIGVIAMIVIGVGVALFYPSPGPKVRQKPADAQAGEAQTTPTSVPEQTPPQPPPVQQIPDARVKAQPPAKTAKPPLPKVAKDQAKDQVKETVKKPEETPIQGFEGNSTYDGMTQRDIPRLLQWARSDAGNGRYEKAGQEYRVILQLQPNNADAKEGLRKLQLAQQRNQ